MLEVTHAGKYHGDAVGITSVDRILIVLRAARLNDAGNARLSRRLCTVVKGEEGIRAKRRALDLVATALDRHLRGPESIDLPRPYA